MNKERRKQLSEAIDAIMGAKEIVEMCRDEEQDCYDNLPESQQDGERGEKMSEAIDSLDAACDSLDEAIDSIEEAQA